MTKQRCGKCSGHVEFAQAHAVANRVWHAECFFCSVCNRQLTASPYHPPGQTVKATVEEPELFCSDCAEPEFSQRGLVFSLHHTLAGPPGFGTMRNTVAATSTYTKPSLMGNAMSMTNTPHAVPSGRHTITPKQCTTCGSPKWLAHGFERCRCADCGTVF